MDIYDFLWNSPVVGIVFCLAVAVIIFWVLIRVEKKFLPKKKSNVVYIRVPGKLVKIKQKFLFSRGWFVTLFIFRFTTEGGDVIEADCTPDLPNIMYLYEGADVKIYYHPNNPYDFYVQ